jgi:hypothetical protein
MQVCPGSVCKSTFVMTLILFTTRTYGLEGYVNEVEGAWGCKKCILISSAPLLTHKIHCTHQQSSYMHVTNPEISFSSDCKSYQHKSKCIYKYFYVRTLHWQLFWHEKVSTLTPPPPPPPPSISCKLSFLAVYLKISSLPIFSLRSNKIFMWYFKTHALVPHKSHPSYHHFYPHLVHAHSEQYHTNDLSESYMTSYY